MKYMAEVWTENNKRIDFLMETPDAYCAEIEIKKKFPSYEIGEIKRLVDFNEYKITK